MVLLTELHSILTLLMITVMICVGITLQLLTSVSDVIFIRAHDDEVLDVTFDYTGQHLATASTDGVCV